MKTTLPPGNATFVDLANVIDIDLLLHKYGPNIGEFFCLVALFLGL
jgi:hypothetical protein